MEDILNSYWNGQRKQFIDQVSEYGITKFTRGLREIDHLPNDDKLDILHDLLILTNL